MKSLRLYLLGTPQLDEENRPLAIPRRKALALLSYLALTGTSHNRESLATLFWPDTGSKNSRAALRRILSDLNQLLPTNWANITGDTIALNPAIDLWVDALVFRSLLADCQAHGHNSEETCPACIPLLSEAIHLYQDHLLAGFSLPDSPAFDDWLFFEADGLRRELVGALDKLVNYFLSEPDAPAEHLETALQSARRWAAIEPLYEAPQQALMELYARAGQPAAALRQYQEYIRLLDKELSATPSQLLTDLFDEIRRQGIQIDRASRHTRTPRKPAEERSSPTEGSAVPSTAAKPASPASQPGAQATDEIRLTTALFVGLHPQDGQDWSRHPEYLAEKAHRLVQIVQQIVAKYSAQINPFVGQGLFVFFGSPQVHEDDAERALRAALEIQEAAASQAILVSIGASTGQVYCSPIEKTTTLYPGPGEENQILMVGPTLNLAARLQNLAQPGEVLVSPTTYRHTRRVFEFIEIILEDNGQTGQEYLVTSQTDSPILYRLLRALPLPEKGRGIEGLQAALIGRDEEIRKLRTALSNVLRGQGRLITLSGEAGMGKTRLVTELKNKAISAWDEGTLLLWLEGRCLEWRTATSYWPFIDLFRNLLYFSSDEENSRAQSLVSMLEEMQQRSDLTANRVDEIGALLGNLLSIYFNNDWDSRLKNASLEQVQHQTFLAIYDFLVALAQQQPLVLVFEDLQWADDLSLDLLSLLMEAIPSSPILLICIYRPQQTHKGRRLSSIAAEKIPGQDTHIDLRELDPEQSLHLVQSMLATSNLPPTLGNLVVKKSYGNPFFIEEAIRALVDQGILYQHTNGWQMRATPELLSIPESVQSIILSRIDYLSQDLKSVLRAAAIIGKRFSLRLLSQIVPAEINLDQSLWNLEEAALIYRERILPEVEYTFKHILIQEAVYYTISSRQHGELHLKVAQALENLADEKLKNRQNLTASTNPAQAVLRADAFDDVIEDLAYHYQRSPALDKAIEYLLIAGENARRGYHHKQAIDHFKQALYRWEKLFPTLDEPHPSQAQLSWKLAALAGLGQIYHGLGQYIEAEKYLLQAIAIGQAVELDTPALVRLYYWVGEALHWQRRYTEQIHLGQTGLALLAEDERLSLEEALMNQIIAIGQLGRGNETAFQELTRQTAQFIRQLPYSEELRPAYVHIILSLYNQRQVEQAGQWMAELQRLGETHHDLRALAEVYDYQWGYHYQSGDLQNAIDITQRALEFYPKIGDNFRIWRCQRDMAWGHLMLGELDTAEHLAEQSLKMAYNLGVAAYQAASMLITGLIRFCQHDWNRAIEAFQHAAQLVVGRERAWTGWMADYCLGRAWLASGDLPAALEQLRQIVQSDIPSHVPLGWWFNRWPVYASALNALEAAEQAAEQFALNPVSGAPNSYKEICHKIEKLQTDTWVQPVPKQCSLKAGYPPTASTGSWIELSDNMLDQGWMWIDPCGDSCCQTLPDRNTPSQQTYRLEISAANGQDLWHLNLNAPRLLRAVKENFSIQVTCCAPPPANKSTSPEIAIGGLLVWQDENNFMRLVWGLHGPNDLSFEGCLQNRSVIQGRGLLPGAMLAEQSVGAILCLEKRGDWIEALCAPIDQPAAWYSVGRAYFSSCGSLQAGLHAVGWIDRSAYPGAYPRGTRTQFQELHMEE